MRSYKRTSDDQLKFASQSLAVSSVAAVESKKVVGDKDLCEKKAEREVWCVDSTVEKPQVVCSEIVPNSHLSLHKKMCVMKGPDGKCPPLCKVLEKIDKKCEKRSLKQLKLSLKYQKKRQ